MVIENTKKVQVNQQKTRRHHWLSLLIAVLFALMVCPSKAPAQIIGNLEVNIPFQFHAGNAKLPPGKYIIHMLDNSDLTIMEISSAVPKSTYEKKIGQASTEAQTHVAANHQGTTGKVAVN